MTDCGEGNELNITSTWWVEWLEKGMNPCGTNAVACHIYEESRADRVDSLHKVLAGEEATGNEIWAAAYPSIWQWVVLGVAIGVTDWCFLTAMPFGLKSTTPSWQIAMPTTVTKLIIQCLFK